MAIHNTSYDAANTAVRAFLTKVGAKYLGRSFNTGSGSGESMWIKIKDKIFEGEYIKLFNMPPNKEGCRELKVDLFGFFEDLLKAISPEVK